MVVDADLVGFGSGIYMANFHRKFLSFLKELPEVSDKKAFIFSTSGVKKNLILNRGHKTVRKILKNKGFKVIGELDCLGYDDYGPLKLIGGINKGRPDEKDKKRAKDFAEKIKKASS